MVKRLYQWITVCLFGVMAIGMTVEPVNAEISTVQEISGFDNFDFQKNAMYFDAEDRPSLEELIQFMPDTLSVFTMGSEEAKVIDVDWFCVTEDYEDAEYYYYQFSPKWDETEYKLDENIDLITEAPYISVFFNTTNNIMTLAETDTSNETIIYQFLRDELKLNIAAASGVLANIYHESAFNPEAYNGNDSGGTVSYGICQWNNGAAAGNRYGALIDWCGENGYDYTTLEGQLNYMKHELKTMPYYRLSVLQDMPESPDAAYDASIIWSTYYEGCAKSYYEIRANLAKNTYWEKYSGLAVSDSNTPKIIMEGDTFSISGTISSDTVLANVTVGIYNTDNMVQMEKSMEPNSDSFHLEEVSSELLFEQLIPGEYIYRVAVKNDTVDAILINTAFTVLEKLPFIDVSAQDWFLEAVHYNYMEGLMTGMQADIFGPYESLSRAQFAVMLYRLEGKPDVIAESRFPDVASDTWYTDAVIWASQNGIITGYADGNFGPVDYITREQMATIMYRYAKLKECDLNDSVNLNMFADGSTVSSFASDAMSWAAGGGIITGKDSGTRLAPQENAARAECAAIFMRFKNSYL